MATIDREISLVIKVKDMATAALDKMKGTVTAAGTAVKSAFKGSSSEINKLNSELNKTSSTFGNMKNNISGFGAAVTSNINQASTGMNNLAAASTKAATAANQTKNAMSGISGAVGGVSSAITAAATGFLAVTSGLQMAWNAYRDLTTVQLENAAVWERLNISIVAFGDSIESVRPKVEAFAANAREIYGLDEEDVVAMLMQIANATGSWAAALQMAEPAIVAVQTGLVDLNGAAGLFAKAFEGNTMMLERTFPVLKAYREEIEATAKAQGITLSDQEISAAMMERFMEIFGKMTAEQSKSQKALREYDNQIEDLKIQLAEILPNFQKILEVFKASIKFFADNAQAISLVWKAFAGYKILSTVIPMISKLSTVILTLRTAMIAAQTSSVAMAASINAISFAGLGAAVYFAITKLSELKNAIKEANDAAKTLDKTFAETEYSKSKLYESARGGPSVKDISGKIAVEKDPAKKLKLQEDLLKKRRAIISAEISRYEDTLNKAQKQTQVNFSAKGMAAWAGQFFGGDKGERPEIEAKLKSLKNEMSEINKEQQKLYAPKGQLPIVKDAEKLQKARAAKGGGSRAAGGDPFASFLSEQEQRSRFADVQQRLTGGFEEAQKAKLDLEYWKGALQEAQKFKKNQLELLPIYEHIADAQDRLKKATENTSKEAQKELKYKQEIASLQKEVERVGEERYFAGWEEAIAKAKDDFAQYTDELKKGYEGTLSELSAKTTEQHKKISDLSRESYDMKKKNSELEELANIYAMKHALTLEDQVKFQQEISFAMQRMGKTNEEALAIQQQYVRESIELSIVLNQQVGLQAEITRYQGTRNMLAQGMYKDLSEQASMMSTIFDFEMRIADEYGVTREEAVAMIPVLKSLTEKELDRFKALKNIQKTYAETQKDIKFLTMFPDLEKGFSATSKQMDALKQRILALGREDIDSGVIRPLYMQYQQLAAKLEQEELIDPQKAIDEAKRLAEQFHNQMRDGLASAIEEGFEKGGMAAVENFAKFLKDRIKKEAAEGLADAIMGKTTTGAPGGFLANMFGGGGGKVAPATAVANLIPGQLAKSQQAAEVVIPGAQIADYMKSPAASNAFAAGWKTMMDRQPNKNYAFARGWESMMDRQPQPSAAGTAAQMAQAGGMAAPGGGGALGFLGKASPYLGAALLIAGMFKKGPGAPMSGVAALPGQGTNIFGGGLDVLRGSDVYRRAAFSSRNINQDLTSAMAAPRLRNESEIVVRVEPSAEFDAKVKGSMAEGVRLSSTRGVPRRTGFTHG